MNDARTLRDLQVILAAGDVAALWNRQMLRRLAGLSKTSLASAKREIRRRFGLDCCPLLLSRAIREERTGLLQSLRAEQFNSKSGSISLSKRAGSDRLMALFARRGGMVRCKKGLARMSPQKLAAVRAAALAGRKRAKASREAARAEREPPIAAVVTGRDLAGVPRAEAVALLAAAWNLTTELAARRLERELESAESMTVGFICPARVPDASAASTVAVGAQSDNADSATVEDELAGRDNDVS